MTHLVRSLDYARDRNGREHWLLPALWLTDRVEIGAQAPRTHFDGVYPERSRRAPDTLWVRFSAGSRWARVTASYPRNFPSLTPSRR
jgi:hypothetical protein